MELKFKMEREREKTKCYMKAVQDYLDEMLKEMSSKDPLFHCNYAPILLSKMDQLAYEYCKQSPVVREKGYGEDDLKAKIKINTSKVTWEVLPIRSDAAYYKELYTLKSQILCGIGLHMYMDPDYSHL